MGGQEQEPIKRRIHSLKYIEQMMAWGFDKEFIARDMGVSLSSLETRLRRARVREQTNENRNFKSAENRIADNNINHIMDNEIT